MYCTVPLRVLDGLADEEERIPRMSFLGSGQSLHLRSTD